MLIASQTLAALHGVAHANVRGNIYGDVAALASVGEQQQTSSRVEHLKSSHQHFWATLFGHAADGAENNRACIGWDAGFAHAAPGGGSGCLPQLVAYTVFVFPQNSITLNSANLLRAAQARAPPLA